MTAINEVLQLITAVHDYLQDNKASITNGAAGIEIFISNTDQCEPPNEAGYPCVVIGNPQEDYEWQMAYEGTAVVDVHLALYDEYVEDDEAAQGGPNQEGLPEMARNLFQLLKGYTFDSDSTIELAQPLRTEANQLLGKARSVVDIEEDDEFDGVIMDPFYRKKMIVRYKYEIV